mgnify:CR=1 FL=1
MKIRKAKKGDFNKIVEIYVESFSGQPYNEIWTKEKALNKIKILSKYCDFFVLEINNKVGGFMILNPFKWYSGKTVEGEEFAIKKEFRGKGLGKTFLEEIEKIYKKRGFKSFIFISHKNPGPAKYYKKLGYKETKLNSLFEKKLKWKKVRQSSSTPAFW